MVSKVALEEHFLCPGFETYWQSTVGNVDPERLQPLLQRLSDFGEQRLSGMKDAGISRAVLSLAGPGVQMERDAGVAVRLAKQANDFLAQKIGDNRKSYSGFAHLPMQDPQAAADELRRCVQDLQFCGAMINGHTNGVYLDDARYDAFWERAQALNTTIYIHPNDPVAESPALAGHPALKRATWEWTFETGTHALRLVFGGVFDRFPKLKIVLGHLGETLPYLLWRFDSRAKLYGVKLSKKPSEYIRENMRVTTSGMFSNEPLRCAIDAMGVGCVMFSADYPFESMKEAGEFFDAAKISDRERLLVGYENANNLLNLAEKG